MMKKTQTLAAFRSIITLTLIGMAQDRKSALPLAWVLLSLLSDVHEETTP